LQLQLGGDEIELDIDELSPEVLHKLYKFVSKNTSTPSRPQPPIQAPAPANASSKSSRAVNKPKKNKPMSATEQERKIKELENRLGGFDNEQAASPTTVPRSLGTTGQSGRKFPSWFSFSSPSAQIADKNPLYADAEESSSDDDSSSGSESEEE